ncbi:MAG: head-tail connector protein [Magnetococcales bacterium]|nr:head-tail connector protein [Magnetococcales bacterium]
MNDIGQKIIRRYSALKEARGSWESQWREVGDHVLPRKSTFQGGREKGARLTRRTYDSTPRHANTLLAAALHGMLTSPSSKWFSLRLRGVPDHIETLPEVSRWLETAEATIYEELNTPAAGFSSHMHEIYTDLPAFGTAILFVGENNRSGGPLFQSRPLSDCVIAENADGIVDTLYRRFTWTVRQTVQQFGKEALSAPLQRLIDQGEMDKEIGIIHAVFPREERDHGRRDARNLPWSSLYVEEESKHLISESGYEEMPYMVARWSKATGETYGRGPAMDAMEDISMLQEMTKTLIRAAQKVVDPPLQVQDDSALSPVRMAPGALTFRRPGSEPIRPLQTGSNIPIGLEMIQAVQQKIYAAFFVDQLQLKESPNMTATEVMARQEERLRMMGPVLGRLQTELLGPLLDRVWGVMWRAGRFMEPPEILSGLPLRIEYVSPIARAQKQIEAQAVARVYQFAGPIAQHQPEVMKAINGTKLVRHLSELFGLPPSILRSERELEKIKQEEMAMMQQQQQAMQAQQMLAVGEKMAKIEKTTAEAQAMVQ